MCMCVCVFLCVFENSNSRYKITDLIYDTFPKKMFYVQYQL